MPSPELECAVLRLRLSTLNNKKHVLWHARSPSGRSFLWPVRLLSVLFYCCDHNFQFAACHGLKKKALCEIVRAQITAASTPAAATEKKIASSPLLVRSSVFRFAALQALPVCWLLLVSAHVCWPVFRISEQRILPWELAPPHNTTGKHSHVGCCGNCMVALQYHMLHVCWCWQVWADRRGSQQTGGPIPANMPCNLQGHLG